MFSGGEEDRLLRSLVTLAHDLWGVEFEEHWSFESRAWNFAFNMANAGAMFFAARPEGENDQVVGYVWGWETTPIIMRRTSKFTRKVRTLFTEGSRVWWVNAIGVGHLY